MMKASAASGNAVLAKARALYGRRLRADDYRRLMGCRTMTELAAALKDIKERFITKDGQDLSMYQEPLVMTPSPKAVLDNIVPDFVMGYVYGALVESFCSEQNARMMAMEAANKNASAMIHDLSIQYNRVRQAMITQEITEVIAGAKAQKKKKKARKEVLSN